MPNFHTASTVDAVNISAAAMGSAATTNRRTYASMYISDTAPRPVLSIGLVSMKKTWDFFFSISINKWMKHYSTMWPEKPEKPITSELFKNFEQNSAQ